jgi:hypothetical protein
MAQTKTKDTSIPTQEPVPVEGTTPSSPFPARKSTCSRLFRYIIPAVAIIFLFVNVGLFGYLKIVTNQQNRKIAMQPTPTPSPSPTPTPTPTPYPLPQGKKSFLFSYTSGAKGPQLEKVTIDPYDPKIGQSQTYTVVASDTSPVVSVELALHTDNKVASYPLARISGTETKGTWQVKITTDDTHLYQYYPYFVVKSTADEFHGGLTLRAY